MDPLSNRRRFLSLAGTGAAVSIAGCSQLDRSTDGPQNDSVGGESDDEDGENAADGGAATSTAYVQPAQEDLTELQQRQMQLQQQAQAGEINESEYEAELQSLQEDQAELVAAAMTEFESYAADEDALEIADSSDETGLFLLEAPADVLLAALNDEAVTGLLPATAFEEAQQQQGQSP